MRKAKNIISDNELKRMFFFLGKDILLNENFIKEKNFIQHGKTTTLMHSLAVSYYSFRFAMKHNYHIDFSSLVRGALLHDFYLYDWHDKNKNISWHGYVHPYIAVKRAKEHFNINHIEEDIICKHMFPLTLSLPYCKESFLVMIFDKICSIKEIFIKEPYLKLSDLIIYNI